MSAEQPAGPDVDTAAIRTRWGRSAILDIEVRALCDALDARDTEIADQRMVIAHQRDMRHAQQAEIRELRAERDDWQQRWQAADNYGAATRLAELARIAERDDARARLEEIQACVDGVTCQIPHLCAQAPQCLACLIGRILDRQPKP